MSDHRERACPSCGSYLHHDCCEVAVDSETDTTVNAEAERVRAVLFDGLSKAKSVRIAELEARIADLERERNEWADRIALALGKPDFDSGPEEAAGAIVAIRRDRDDAIKVLRRLKRDVRAALSGPPGPPDALADLVADVRHALDSGLGADKVDDLREAVRVAEVAMYREGM